MVDRTEGLALTHEENCGWFTAMKELRAWHQTKIPEASKKERAAHCEAIDEIERLIAIQTDRYPRYEAKQ